MRNDDKRWDRPFPFETYRATILRALPKESRPPRKNSHARLIWDAVKGGANSFTQLLSETTFAYPGWSTNQLAWRTHEKLKEMQDKKMVEITQGQVLGTVLPCGIK